MDIIGMIKRMLGIKKNKKEKRIDVKPLKTVMYSEPDYYHEPVINEESDFYLSEDDQSGFHSEYCYNNIDTRPTCSLCGCKIGGMNMYRCYYCDQLFCDAHRLPENHNCPNIQSLSSEARARTTSITFRK